ncbi:MAG: SIS domain-containing protein [Candidatus Altiarchaeales archaeon]|nr:SIS domain-containing protein [Candidatus Altiarchaeales archaeon]
MKSGAYLDGYLEELKGSLDSVSREEFEEIAEALLQARRRGSQVFIMGNGGSASTASHMACDLGKGCNVEGKKRFRAISLSDNIPLMTAWGNDTSYDNIFSEQLENHVQEGDLVIGISGSGNSPNVLNALKLARKKKAKTIGLTGFKGGKMKDLCDICLIVPSDNMQRIEDAHLIIEHALSLYLKEKITEEV